MLVVSMDITIHSCAWEADQKSETQFAEPGGKLQIETRLMFVRRVTQLKQELIRKLVWKRGSEQ
jgi:hypothetical protein